MANLIKIGTRIIDLDRLDHAELDRRPDPENPGRSYADITINGSLLRFEGTEADAIRRCLGELARDLTPNTPEDREWAEFRERGGTMSRGRWNLLRNEIRHLNEIADPNRRVLDRMSEIEAELLV